MPGFIHTRGDEARWSRAKAAAGKQLSVKDGDSYWALTNHIYQKMTKIEDDEAEDLDKGPVTSLKPPKEWWDKMKEEGMNDAVIGDIWYHNMSTSERRSKRKVEGKKYGEAKKSLDSQFYDILYKALSAQELIKKYEEGDISETDQQHEDDPEPKDDADKWLSEAESKSDTALEPQKKTSSSYRDWKPREDYTDEESKKIMDHVNNGYTHREAERMAGLDKESPTDFQRALHHTVKASEPSQKMLDDLREHASNFVKKYEKQRMTSAEAHKNPVRYAENKMSQAHEEHGAKYTKEYNDFLNSDETKKLKGIERVKATQDWKNKWHEKNPEYKKGLTNLSNLNTEYSTARELSAKDINEKIAHMTGFGHSGAGGESTLAEGIQHVGGESDEQRGPQMTIKQDPLTTFAHSNPKLINIIKQHATPEMVDRLNRINAARAHQGAEAPAAASTAATMQEPSPHGKVKVWTPEEIAAKYGKKE